MGANACGGTPKRAPVAGRVLPPAFTLSYSRHTSSTRVCLSLYFMAVYSLDGFWDPKDGSYVQSVRDAAQSIVGNKMIVPLLFSLKISKEKENRWPYIADVYLLYLIDRMGSNAENEAFKNMIVEYETKTIACKNWAQQVQCLFSFFGTCNY